MDEDSDIKQLLQRNGYILRELPACKTWEEYQKLGEAETFISCYPPAKYGADILAERFKREHLYLPGSFDYDEIKEELRTLINKLKINMQAEELEVYFKRETVRCEESLSNAKNVIGDTPVMLDYMFHPRPLGLAKVLLEHGFQVKMICLDSISPEEKSAFDWLKIHYPELELRATIPAKMRVLPRKTENKVLAIGQKAAWFSESRNFVNMVQGGGLWGFEGIRRTAQLMTEAFLEEKDPEDLIVRKGWGCESCI